MVIPRRTTAPARQELVDFQRQLSARCWVAVLCTRSKFLKKGSIGRELQNTRCFGHRAGNALYTVGMVTASTYTYT
jgi:hypothetical protein